MQVFQFPDCKWRLENPQRLGFKLYNRKIGVLKIAASHRKKTDRILRLSIKTSMGVGMGTIFNEEYRVVSVEGQHLTIRGVRTGKVLTIINTDPAAPLTPSEYPPGKLIALSDPSQSQPN
jgi:hypothetical protein